MTSTNKQTLTIAKLTTKKITKVSFQLKTPLRNWPVKWNNKISVTEIAAEYLRQHQRKLRTHACVFALSLEDKATKARKNFSNGVVPTPLEKFLSVLWKIHPVKDFHPAQTKSLSHSLKLCYLGQISKTSRSTSSHYTNCICICIVLTPITLRKPLGHSTVDSSSHFTGKINDLTSCLYHSLQRPASHSRGIIITRGPCPRQNVVSVIVVALATHRILVTGFDDLVGLKNIYREGHQST